MSLLRVTLIGHLGHDPSLKTLSTGEYVCNFSVAHSEKWKDSKTGEQKEKTQWFNVQVFGKQAEHCKSYLSKGSLVYLEGKFDCRAYTAKNGDLRASVDVTANLIRFLDKRPQDGVKNASSGEPENYKQAGQEHATQEVPGWEDVDF